MFEVAAAGIGAALSAAFMGLASTQKRHAENRDCLIRLSSSLEQVSDRLEAVSYTHLTLPTNREV